MKADQQKEERARVGRQPGVAGPEGLGEGAAGQQESRGWTLVTGCSPSRAPSSQTAGHVPCLAGNQHGEIGNAKARGREERLCLFEAAAGWPFTRWPQYYESCNSALRKYISFPFEAFVSFKKNFIVWESLY